MSSSSKTNPQPPPHIFRPGGSRSTRSLGRGSSPQWKDHYANVAKLWGSQTMTSNLTSESMSKGELWNEVREQKQKGVYPFTHLSHKQEEEVWIDPLSLPKDIATATLRRKEIPREWFHLPQGIEPPSTTDLLKESSEEDEENFSASDLHHSRICGRGRSRSKSKEKKLNKNIKKEQIQNADKKVSIRQTTQVAAQEQHKPVKSPPKSDKKKNSEVQYPGPPVPPKFTTSREPYPLPREKFVETEDDGEYELDTRWTSETKRKSRSKSRDNSKKSPKSPRSVTKVLSRTPPPPPRSNEPSQSLNNKNKVIDDGGYEPVGSARKSLGLFGKDKPTSSNGVESANGAVSSVKGKAYEDLPDSVEGVIDLPFTKGGARISRKDFVTVESGQDERIEPEFDLESITSVLEEDNEKETLTTPLPEPTKEVEVSKKEQKKLQKERIELDKKAKKEQDKLAKEEQEKLEKDRIEAEKKAKKEREKLAKEEQERLKKLKKEQEKATKLEQERLKREKKEQEKAEKLRITKEKKEKHLNFKNWSNDKNLELLSDSKQQLTSEPTTSSQLQSTAADTIVNQPVEIQSDKKDIKSKSEDERLPKFFSMPLKDEPKTSKTKILVDIKKIDPTIGRDPFEDTLRSKFLDPPLKSVKDSSESQFAPISSVVSSDQIKTETKAAPSKIDSNVEKPSSFGKKIGEDTPTIKTTYKSSTVKESPVKSQTHIKSQIELKPQFNTSLSSKIDTKSVAMDHNDIKMSGAAKEDPPATKIKSKVEIDFDDLFTPPSTMKKESTHQASKNLSEKSGEVPLKKRTQHEDENKIEVVPETTGRIRKYSDRKSSFQEYDEDQELIYDPNEEKLDEVFRERFEHLLLEDMPESVVGEEVKLSKKEKKELKKMEKEKKKADKIDKEQTLKQEKLQARLEKQMIAKEKKDLEVAEKERKKAERDWIKHQKQEEKKLAKLEKEEEKKIAKLEKEEEKKMAKLERKNKQHKRTFFKILQKKGKAKSLSDLNENDPLIIKEFPFEDDEEQEEEEIIPDIQEEKKKNEELVTSETLKKDNSKPSDEDPSLKLFKTTTEKRTEEQTNGFAKEKEQSKQPVLKTSPQKESEEVSSKIYEPTNEKVINDDSSQKDQIKKPKQSGVAIKEPLKDNSEKQNSVKMASKTAYPRDDFAAFQNQSGTRSHEEEEIDFTPQNGYVFDEKTMEDLGYIAVDEDVEEEDKKNKRKSRERRNFKAGLSKSVSNFNSKIRNARFPSPHELKAGYMNSNLHKSFQQPLVSRSRVENVDVQKARALLVKHNTPSELAKMKHPLDIPLPKFGGGENKPEKPPKNSDDKPEPKENGHVEERPASRGGKMYQTLPRSWRETQLVTAVRENGDPEEMAERLELVRSKTPAELAQLHSISDFPVPSRLANLFHPSTDESKTKNQSSTSIDKPKEPFKMENMIPSSLRETKLITNVREITDEATLKSRQNLVQQNTPGELAKFHSLSDFPVPTRIENIFKPRSRSSSATRKGGAERRSSTASSQRSKSLTRSLSGTIPRSWRETQLLTGVKIDPNQEEIARRRALIENTTPAELSKITSVADLPVPTALQNIFSGSSKKDEKEAKNEEKTSKPMNLEEMYNNLPRSLKTELLVKCVENDQDLTKKRQKLVESMKPKELAQIGSLSEFPVPSVLENIFKEKDPSATPRPEKRERNKTVIGLMTYENLPDGLKREVLVRSKVEEDPEVLKERRELVDSKTPAELSRISGFSDFPLPEKIEGLVRPSRRNLRSTKQKDMVKKRSKSWSSLTNPKELYKSLPDSLKSEVLVSVTIEDQDTLKQHKKLVEENSVAELGKIHGVSDFPVPDAIVNLVKSDPNKASESRPDTPAKSLKESFVDAIPESLKSEVLVRSRTEDPELLKERQELTRSKTPNELSQISSISDFPIPTSVENLFKKKEIDPNEPAVPPRRFKKENLYESLPDSLKSEVLVRTKVEEDPEVLKARQELVRSKSPAELSEIHGFDDIPIPSFLTKRKEDSDDQSSKKDDEEPKSLYDKMPDSLKTEMLVRSRVETPEIQKERSELVKNKTVKELSEINGLDDIPIPNFQFLKKKDQNNEDVKEEKEKKSLYEQMPESLKAEVLVQALVEDPKVSKENSDLVKSKSVKELSEIHGISDFPLPTRLEYAIGRKPRPVERRKKFREKQRSLSAKNLHERMYDSIPQSLKAEILVKSVYQDPELQMERRRLVQSKSVGELSQIHSLSDFPLPSAIERLMAKSEEPSEGRPLSRMSLSNISLSRKSLYSALPKSLTTQDCLVRTRVEDPEILRERREIVKTKSVSELATLNSISDFPIPSNVERFIQNRRAKSVDQPRIHLNDGESSRPTSPIEKIKERIPSSMKTELLVSSSVQDPETSQKRKQLTESTSVHELSQLHGISDFPIPDTIENFVKDRLSRNENRPEDEGEEKSPPLDLYASLPKSLKQEVLVRSVVQEGNEELKKRQALVDSKTPAELSQIHSFSEIPVPSRIEAWLSSTDESKLSHPIAPPRSTRSFHELRENMYETLPKSLKEPTLVRTKVEDPEIQKNRSELTRSKTPSQLAEIHGINEIPIPGLWNDGTPKKKSTSSLTGNAVPKTKQEIKDYVYKALFPEALVRPCIVRSKVEDQDRLLERQAIQQSKTIHELSKINNLSDFPLPGNIKLPPIPLPSTKGILKIIAPTRKNKKDSETVVPSAEIPLDQQENQYNHVEDSPYDNSGITDDEMLRYESSTPAESLIREQDFGYEVISAAEVEAQKEEERHRQSDILNIGQIPDKFKDDIRESQPSPRTVEAPSEVPLKTDADDEDSQLVDQYRGTPPRALGRSKMKNKKNRQSQDSVEDGEHVERIQSRPLPAPPTPVRSRGKVAATKKDAQTGTVEIPPPARPSVGAAADLQSSATNTEVFHTVQSSLDQTLVKSRPTYDFDDETLADSVVDSMHSCAETLVDEDATLHEDLREEDVFNHEPYPRTGSVEERLKNETHELSRELLEHVENLRTTLGNMSTRLGTTSPEPPPRK